ncbi:hypothetical protein GCK72_025387 [Caenorhabditis remanei]|uniref:Uncharacterized protein n=1 Tax=Caenorhabditis remanei TaxID=31234 RepID=E3MJP3_CAERE|nr:hypothetical protein GCK72_025387 [Caenorhabditis remanei]EFP03591.1 hypothetical protein CRE_19173 [Caenorhabditis remanei]KAF1748920.1 hypothetical protein GCK72_025387 [Caenorhabditis remanei]
MAAPIVSSSPPFNMDQINQINAFFSSTAGVITFSAIWLFCVIALILITGWLLTRQEEENRISDSAREREAQGHTLLNGSAVDPPVDIDLPTIRTNEEIGKYHRMI